MSIVRFQMVALVLATATLLACSTAGRTGTGQDTVSAPSGLRWVVLSSGSGAVAESGMTIRADYAGFLADGSLFDTSIDSVARDHRSFSSGRPYAPFAFQLGRRQVIAGWDEGIAGMEVGEWRRLIIPPHLGYGAKGTHGIPPHSTLYFDVHLLDVLRSDTVTTMEGLRYIDQRRGTGRKVARGMRLKVDYAGYLADGRVFDTSIESVAREHGFDRGGYPFEPIVFTVGTGQVIQGWDIGLTTDMYVGGRRRLIVPPSLGYGQYGSGPIPPHATLVFDVELLEAQ